MAENPAPSVPNPGVKPPQRGALLVTMRPDAPTITAGASFSISVTINNPFDVSVLIEEITTKLPVDLYDVNQMTQDRHKAKVQHESEVHAGSPRKNPVQFAKDKLLSLGWKNYGAAPSNLATAVETTQKQSTEPIISDPIDKNKILELISPQPDETPEEKNQREQTVSRLVDEIQDTPIQFKPVEIQPGDSITRVFVLQTWRGLWFTPNTYTMDISIKYKIGPVMHNQSVPYTLDIQAGLRYIVVGAVIGSMFGILAKEINVLTTGKWVAFLTTTVSTIIISGFAVIAFARKTGVQPLVTIQDFWGGMLIGFLISYSGTQVLGNLFSGAATSGATVTPIPTFIPTP
jgi:hypothetical protein